MLDDDQLLRYSRQILLHDFDVAGQDSHATGELIARSSEGGGTLQVVGDRPWWVASRPLEARVRGAEVQVRRVGVQVRRMPAGS